MGFTKKTILITGATSGFGKATAFRLAELGHRVYGCARSAENTPADSTLYPVMLKMDVTNDDSVSFAIAEIMRRESKIDVLINNAGIGVAGSVEDTSLEEVERSFRTNYFGTVRLTRAVLPIMRAWNNGLIIIISSMGGLIGLPFQAHYSAAKFALEGLAEGLALEVAPFGIKVSIVEPGDFRTEFTDHRIKSPSADPTGNLSPYHRAFSRAMAVIEKDEQNGSDPVLFVNTIEKIINSPRPRLRYLTGSPNQLFAARLKRLLPDSWFANILAGHYEI